MPCAHEENIMHGMKICLLTTDRSLSRFEEEHDCLSDGAVSAPISPASTSFITDSDTTQTMSVRLGPSLMVSSPKKDQIFHV